VHFTYNFFKLCFTTLVVILFLNPCTPPLRTICEITPGKILKAKTKKYFHRCKPHIYTTDAGPNSLLHAAWSMPKKLKRHPRPRHSVVGQLPQRVLEVVRRDRITQSLPRTWGYSRDAIRAEWETAILRLVYRPGSESRHCAHHHLTVRPGCSLESVIGTRRLPPQLTQRALVALASIAKSASHAQSLPATLCTTCS
jgi:hypothetical protein